MSFNLEANVSFGLRSFSDVLTRMGLPLPVEEKENCAYVAHAPTVRAWVRRERKIMDLLQNGKAIGMYQHSFLLMMFILDADIKKHIMKDDRWQEQDYKWPEDGVPDDYKAVWF